MVAHYAQSLVTSIDEFERLAGINRNLAQKLLDWLDEILHQAQLSLQGLTTDEQNEIFRRYTFNEVAAAAKAWKEALRRADAGAQGRGSVRHSVMLDADGKPYVEIKENILDRVPQKDWISTVKRELSTRFPNGIDMDGWTIGITGQGKNEFTRSRYTQKLKKKDAAVYADKFKAAANLDEIVSSAQNVRNEDPLHLRKDRIQSFNRGDARFRIGEHDYLAKIITGVLPDNREIFYDIVDIQPTTIKEALPSSMAAPSATHYDRSTSPDPTVPQTEPGVNPHSMQEGRKYSRPLVSERDQEAMRMWKEMGTESPRFKDFYSGNVRELYNSDGSPKVVYHGTGELFNSFSPDRKGNLTRAESAKLGYFFTSSPLVAQGYALVEKKNQII